MEYYTQLCVYSRRNRQIETLCIKETGSVASILSGTDYLRFHEEFPTQEGPSDMGLAIVARGPSYPPYSKTMSREFIKQRTSMSDNPVFKQILHTDTKSQYTSHRANYLLEIPDVVDSEGGWGGPGDASASKEEMEEKGAESTEEERMKHTEQEREYIEKITGSYWSLWDTSEYIPWITKYSEKLKRLSSSSLSEINQSIEYLNIVTEGAIRQWKNHTISYPISIGFIEHPKPSRGKGMTELLFTMLNVVTGIYNREEYAMLYVTRICYANGAMKRKQERLRQASLLAHGRLPMNDGGDDIEHFDTYQGDWGKLRAVICLINMRPQEEVVDLEGPLNGDEELTGSHWVALIFTTGKRQDVSKTGLETRDSNTKRKPAEERRMYLIDPYVTYRTQIIDGKEEFVRTEDYGKYRQNTLNRACWQCYKAGLVSSGVICTSGYTPRDFLPEGSDKYPHKTAIYDGLSNFGLADYLLAFTPMNPPSYLNELYYDRKALIVGIPERESKETTTMIELFKEEFKRKEGIIGKSFSMVIETLFPTCTMLYETPDVSLTPFFLISTIQTLLLYDTRRAKSDALFPYNTSEIFHAMSSLSEKGSTAETIYNESKKGYIIEYPAYIAPYNTLADIYKQVTISSFSLNMKITVDMLEKLAGVYAPPY